MVRFLVLFIPILFGFFSARGWYTCRHCSFGGNPCDAEVQIKSITERENERKTKREWVRERESEREGGRGVRARSSAQTQLPGKHTKYAYSDSTSPEAYKIRVSPNLADTQTQLPGKHIQNVPTCTVLRLNFLGSIQNMHTYIRLVQWLNFLGSKQNVHTNN